MLVVEFAPGSALMREQDRASDLPILRNGPPGTFIRYRDVRISLPTDQIVASEERGSSVSIAFGGMRFAGLQDGRLTFRRVRDLRPEQELSPDRSWTMTLEPEWVAAVHQDGELMWPPSVSVQRAGLCATCADARVITSSRGASFSLCQRSATDPEFPRYPRLPVLSCRGYDPRP